MHRLMRSLCHAYVIPLLCRATQHPELSSVDYRVHLILCLAAMLSAGSSFSGLPIIILASAAGA